MEDGWDVIYQYPMIHDGLRGIADFLVRVPEPVGGHAAYEPYDAKLARLAAKPGHVLQLCFYADAIEALTGLAPQRMHLWLGSGEIESLEVKQFRAYWRRLRHRLATIMADRWLTESARRSARTASSASTRTMPGDLAGCRLTRVRSRHPEEGEGRVRGGRNHDVGLAGRGDPATPQVSPTRQDRLRRQAELQVVSRAAPGEPPAFRPIPPGEDPVWGHGYAELPEPDGGDVFFDLEGHPFWTPSSGLFFLFGLWYQVDGTWTYEPRWSHDLVAQDETAAGIVAFFDQRRRDHPGFHVYHYNHTERSALAAMTLGRPSEALFTHLSDTGLFVDLMKVATNSFQVGVESYG